MSEKHKQVILTGDAHLWRDKDKHDATKKNKVREQKFITKKMLKTLNYLKKFLLKAKRWPKIQITYF